MKAAFEKMSFSAAVLAVAGMLSAAPVMGFADDAQVQDAATPADPVYHSAQTHSDMTGSFKIRHRGELKGVWGAVAQIPDSQTHATWAKDSGFAYAYGFRVMDDKGNFSFGGPAKTPEQIEESTIEISPEKAEEGARAFIGNFDWNKVGFSWQSTSKNPPAMETTVDDVSDTEVNGWKMRVLSGTLSSDGKQAAFVMYSVLDGDTVSWCAVVDDSDSPMAKASSKLRDEAERFARSYRDGKDYIARGGSLL